MEQEYFEQINNAYSLGKHKRKLAECEDHIGKISAPYITQEVFYSADKFANDTYSELMKEDPGMTLMNSCPPRNIDPLSNLKLNLDAVKKMLMELIIEESESVTEDVMNNLNKQ